MPVGRLLLCLHSHMPYVLSHGKSPHGTDWINESAAECYLPILHTLDRLHTQGIRPHWTINITPILAEQLEDSAFKSEFADYCQEKIDIAISDQRRFEHEGPLWMQGLAAMWQRVYTNALVQFKHQWGRSIVEAFKFFQDEGCIEVITCGATHGYFPLLGTDESVQAQVKVGVDTYKRHFGRAPRGIWLPECAYRPFYEWKSPIGQNQVPWPRKGVEEFLKENGLEYFFVDSHMIRGGQPLGTYAAKFPQLAELFARSSKFFTPPPEFRSEYEHYMLPNGTVCMARDPETTVKVWSGDTGYPGDEWYLEFHKQLYPGRLRYWRISTEKRDLGKKQPYDPWQAYERIGDHAADFIDTLKGTLGYYKGQADRTGTLVAMYDTELFGHWWWEGPEFLYEAALRLHHDPDLEPVTGGDLIDQEPPKHMITLPEGSWGEGGYHYVWINDDNIWTWEKLYPCERRMRTLAQKCKSGLARDIAIQTARELLLAEASDWQFLISTFSARDYAEIRFQDHIDRFERLADLAERVHAGAKMSADEEAFLAECRQKDAPFPDLDLAPWEKLDHPIETV
jgi:1,4-alpha-glucan branching enzyme